MKKISVVFVSALLFSFLGLYNTTSAANCAPGDLFNTANGQPCGSISTSPSRFLTIGSKGEDVRSVQKILGKEGYSVGVADGNYGKRTARTIREFQEDNDLAITGNVDASTWVKLSTFGTIVASPVFVPVPTSSTLSCGALEQTKQYYYNICKTSGYENVCFTKDGVYNGCTNNSNNDCTANNTNANTNTLCSVGPTTPTIIASASEGGTIYPSGNVSVARGANQTFIFYPNPGYQVSNIGIDNSSSAQVANSYTFYNVTGSHGIGVSFSVIPPTPQLSTVLSPNVGGVYNLNQQLPVSFTPAYGQRVYINLVDSNNGAYDLLSYNYINYLTGIAADRQSISLSLPTSWIATHGYQYKVEVCTANICDRSDNYFTIY